MEEKDLNSQSQALLITKLTLLKEIKPRENWVVFAKTRILADVRRSTSNTLSRSWIGQVFDTISFLRYMGKPAYVLSLLLVFVFGGVTLQVSRNSLPGDVLFSVKSAFEKATLNSLELAQKRLEDLKKIAQENRVKNLSETIKEFKVSVGEASKNFSALVESEPSKALRTGRELVQLQKDKAAIEQVLGTAIGEQESSEIQNTTKILVESELTYLLNHTLTEEQRILLREALLDYQAEDYETALEKIWEISN